MTTITKQAFIDKFGHEQADAVEMAGMSHFEKERIIADQMNHNQDIDPMTQTAGYGSDPFRTALIFAVGYDCYTKSEFAQYHGITLKPAEVDAWIKENINFTQHDGAVDVLAVMAGAFDKFK